MVPGCAGVPADTVTASVFGALVPQLLSAVTDMFPFCPAAPVVTVIEVVPVPAVIDHPVGTVHVCVSRCSGTEAYAVCPISQSRTLGRGTGYSSRL